jgi:hypothetical protein
MAGVGVSAAGDLQLPILLNAQVLSALVLGSALSVPLVPAVLARLKRPMAELHGSSPAQLETRNVHAIPIPLLALGFVLSIGLLVGSTLNPFLYFRF